MINILLEFTSCLNTAGLDQGFVVTSWSVAKPTTCNILEINTPNEKMLLYVKVRGQSPGFWGLTSNRITEIDNSGIPWFVVLLLGSPNRGYLLPKHEVLGSIGNGNWTLSRDGDYKVNEGRYLKKNFSFDSFVEFVARLTAKCR